MNFVQRPVAHAIARRNSMTWLAAGVLAAGMALSVGTARADSNYLTAAGTASAHLNFSIVIPTFLFLQVGTGTSTPAYANNATIDTILFDMSSSVPAIGTGAVQAGTGGDLLAGSVTARVLGNHFTAAVNLTATTAGAMSNGTDTISWSEISVAAPTALVVVPAAAATLAHPGTLAAPFADGAATTVSLTPVNKVINQAAKWTFSYKNTNIPPPGTYGATVANKGQVTYQIAMP
jgi:hypothetical protein